MRREEHKRLWSGGWGRGDQYVLRHAFTPVVLALRFVKTQSSKELEGCGTTGARMLWFLTRRRAVSALHFGSQVLNP